MIGRYLFSFHIRGQTHKRLLSTNPTKPLFALKLGEPIPGLDFLKNVDAPVCKERSEYPGWVNELATPMKTLAKLSKENFEEIDGDDQMRYLKLSRRKTIKENNIDAGLR